MESDIIEFSTLSGILTATKVPETQNDQAEKGSSFIQLNFPIVPSTEYSSEALPISTALNGVPLVDIKETALGELLVNYQTPVSSLNILYMFCCNKIQVNP